MADLEAVTEVAKEIIIPQSQHFREDLFLKDNAIAGLSKLIPLGRQVQTSCPYINRNHIGECPSCSRFCQSKPIIQCV